MIKTMYNAKRYYYDQYDNQEEKELLFNKLDDALIFLYKKGFKSMHYLGFGGSESLTFKHEDGSGDFAYIEAKTEDWVTAKEAKERGLKWEED